MSSQSNAVTRKMQQGDNILNKYWKFFQRHDQLGATEVAIYAVGALVIVGYHIASDGIFSSIVTLVVIQFYSLFLLWESLQERYSFFPNNK